MAQFSYATVRLDNPLAGAIADAELLLAFAAQRSKPIEQAVVAALNTGADGIRRAQDANSAPALADVNSFWGAYDRLAASLAPVSARSIKATEALPGSRFGRHLVTNAVIAFTVFAAVVVLIAYVQIGKSLIDKLDNVHEGSAKLIKQLGENADERERRAQRQNTLARLLGDDAVCPWVASRMEAGFGESKPAKDKRSELLAECQQIRREVDLLDGKRKPMEIELEEMTSLDKYPEPVLLDWYRTCPPLFCSRDWIVQRQAVIADRNAVLQASFARGIHLRASNLLGSVNGHLVPMLMGLLGAFAFILRRSSVQITSYTSTGTSIGMDWMRLCLGAISGVFGAMLVTGNETALKALPPLAIPFLFGYGIEILFSLLDRVVDGFATLTPTKGRDAAP